MTGQVAGAVAVVPMRPDDDRVVPIVAAHIALMDTTSPPDACHRLELAALLDPSITFLAAVDGDHVLGIGAHADVGDDWGEVKSMHVVADRRGQGIGRLMLAAIEAVGRRNGNRVLCLETGAHLSAAIALYERSGYVRRGPFADYAAHPATIFMEKELG